MTDWFPPPSSQLPSSVHALIARRLLERSLLPDRLGRPTSPSRSQYGFSTKFGHPVKLAARRRRNLAVLVFACRRRRRRHY